jgi:hypothetical protein
MVTFNTERVALILKRVTFNTEKGIFYYWKE